MRGECGIWLVAADVYTLRWIEYYIINWYYRHSYVMSEALGVNQYIIGCW